MSDLLKLNFFIVGEVRQFAHKNALHCPREGDVCVFSDTRYRVDRVEWCMDELDVGQRVNIELVDCMREYIKEQ